MGSKKSSKKTLRTPTPGEGESEDGDPLANSLISAVSDLLFCPGGHFFCKWDIIINFIIIVNNYEKR